MRAIVYYMFLNTSIPPLYDAPVRRAMNAAPWLPLINERGIDLVSERVGNYQHNPQLGVLLDQLWVE